jgi:hypothetical protein
LTETISRLLRLPLGTPIPAVVLAEPETTGDEPYDLLLATALAYAMEKRGTAPHEWMLRPAALPREWLWGGEEHASTEFREFIRSRTPEVFLRKNILLRTRDLEAF